MRGQNRSSTYLIDTAIAWRVQEASIVPLSRLGCPFETEEAPNMVYQVRGSIYR